MGQGSPYSTGQTWEEIADTVREWHFDTYGTYDFIINLLPTPPK
jgi:hypothetical protein